MTHAELRQALAVYRDLRGAEREEVDHHLAGCTECSSLLNAYRVMDRNLASLRNARPDNRLREGFYAAIDDRRAVPGMQRERAGRPRVQLVMFAAAAVLLLVMASFAFSAPQPSDGTPTPTQVSMGTPAPQSLGDWEGAQVTLDIFSGRPNPSWTLPAEQAQELRRLLATLPEVPCRPPDQASGYRGFVVVLGQRPELSNEYRLRVFAGQVRWGDPWNPRAAATCRSDADRQVERFLLAGGQGRLADDIYAMVAANTRPPTPRCDVVCQDATASVMFTLTPLATVTQSPSFRATEDAYNQWRQATETRQAQFTPTPEHPAPSPAATLTPPPARTPSGLQQPSALSAGGQVRPVLLFARGDDLWRADLDGQHQEPLTSNDALNWGSASNDAGAYWRSANYRPPSVSPDGRWIALSRTGLDLWLINVSDRSLARLPDPGAAKAIWSPDSRYLAYAPDPMGSQPDSLLVYDLREKRAARVFEAPRSQGKIQSLVWSPDSQDIAFACCFTVPTPQTSEKYLEGLIKSINLKTSDVQTWGKVDSAFGTGTPPVCWTTDGKVGTGQGSACSGRKAGMTATSPDGQRTAIMSAINGSGGQGVTVLDASDDRVLWQHDWMPQSKDAALQRLIWSPDGAYLLLDDAQTHSPIWRMSADGRGELEELIVDGFLIGIVPQW